MYSNEFVTTEKCNVCPATATVHRRVTSGIDADTIVTTWHGTHRGCPGDVPHRVTPPPPPRWVSASEWVEARQAALEKASGYSDVTLARMHTADLGEYL